MTRRTSCYLRHVSAHAYLLGHLRGLALQRDWGICAVISLPSLMERWLLQESSLNTGLLWTYWMSPKCGGLSISSRTSKWAGREAGDHLIQSPTLRFINCLFFLSLSLWPHSRMNVFRPHLSGDPWIFLMVPFVKEKVEEMSIQLNYLYIFSKNIYEIRIST